MLERQKEELNYFYGTRAFQLMKDLNEKQVKTYLDVGDIAYGGSHEFKWIREYRRCKYFIFISLVVSMNINRDTTTEASSSKDFSVTEDYEKVKENEWWIRQKYKLMKALKEKWKDSQEAKLLEENVELSPYMHKPVLYK